MLGRIDRPLLHNIRQTRDKMDEIFSFISVNQLRILDILGTAVGLVYVYLEYRASIWLWVASIVMPLIDMFLYLEAGLYADFGMAIYYALAAIYGFIVWKWCKKRGQKKAGEMPITHFKTSLVVPAALVFLAAWAAIYCILTTFTNSNVPVTDSFVNALSIVALWALARKYLEQWLLWIVVDAVCCALYAYKGIPFKAGLYGLYVVIAILGYMKWRTMMNDDATKRQI